MSVDPKIAQYEIATLRRDNANRDAYMARVTYWQVFLARTAHDFEADLESWENGTNKRPDLADPRDPEVSRRRTEHLEQMQAIADAIFTAAPEGD